MTPKSLTRNQILQALVAALEPLAYVHALWEGGAAAFGRLDEWSDIDLCLDVADDRVADTFSVIEQALSAEAPIELKYEIPQPAWHGHAQAFYRLRTDNPFLILDITVIQHSNPNKFLELELHGNPVVHFDKSGIVQSISLDREELAARLQKRMITLRVTFDLFQALTIKEINRGNDIEALAFYHGFTLRPLVEALRIHYQPDRYNFYTRYIHYDLPTGVVQRLGDLYFVKDINDLRSKRQAAEEWFYHIVDQATGRPTNTSQS